MKPGDKIKFDSEKQRYTVQACDARFAIMTKPFNARRTFLYTITDLERKERGPCNLIFGPNSKLDELCGAAEALSELQTGRMQVSHRHCVELTAAEIAQIA